MNTPGDFKNQLEELTVLLCQKVAERLATWSKDVEPSKRQGILKMIEEDLPVVVANTIAKSASLHSTSGVQYLEQHLDDWADNFARKFVSPS